MADLPERPSYLKYAFANAYNLSLLGTIELSDAEVDDIVIPNVRMFLRAHRPGA